MKFVCDRCQTRYSIADEKVLQRILRIRCKTCGNVITLQGGEVVSGPQDALRRPESGVRAASAPASVPSSRPARPPSGLHEWFVAVDGVERGPLSCTDAAKYIVSRKPEQSVHVWKEGMDGWKRPKDVAIIAQEITALKAAPAGPSPHTPVAATRADTSSALRSAPSPADLAPGFLAPGTRPKPPPAAGSGSGARLPQPGSDLKSSPAAPGSGPKLPAPPVPGSGPKAAPPPIPGSGPKTVPPPIPGLGPKTAPPPVPGPKPAPAGGSGPQRAQPSGSQPVPGMPGSAGPKLPPPTSGSGAKPPQPVLPDFLAETPLPDLGAGAPHPGPRPVAKLSVVSPLKPGPVLPGLTPVSAGELSPGATLDKEFDKAPTTKPEKRLSGPRGVTAPGSPGTAQPPGERPNQEEFDQGQTTPPPSKPLPPIVVPARDGREGKNPPLSGLASAPLPALPQPFDWSGTGPAAGAAMNVSATPAPPAGSFFANVAALPATLFPAPHSEAGLSKLTGLAALAHRHRHLKYVVAAGIVVILVILVILLSWRGERGKAVGSVFRRAAPVPPAPSSVEAEPPPQDENTGEPQGRPKVRAARAVPRHSAVARSAGPSGKAAALGDDPFEGPSARSRSPERPAPVAKPTQPSRPRSSPSAGEGRGISQSQISEVVRNKENQAGLKSCYERALRRDGRLRTGRLDITVSVAESGVVQQVQVHGPSDFLLIDGCLKNAIRHWRFPANVEEYATSFPLILQGG